MSLGETPARSAYLSMSIRLLGEEVIFCQRLLAADGFYTGRVDGVWGRLTERAFRAFEARGEALMRRTARFAARSENEIRSLTLPAQKLAREMLFTLDHAGLHAQILSGTRTYTEQNKLWAIGRGVDDPRFPVTHAKGGRSAHNFGIAWDLGLFTSTGGYVLEEAPYAEAGELIAAEFDGRIAWGGSWKTFRDLPHYQLALPINLSEVRAQFESGTLRLSRYCDAGETEAA